MKKTTINVEASIIGTLFCAPDYFEKASLHLRPEMFVHYRKAYEWMCKQFEEQRSWDVQICGAKFGDISDLIVAAEPETISSAISYLQDEYNREQDKATYISAAAMLESMDPQDARQYVLSRITETIAPIEEERSRGSKIREALQSIEKMDNGTAVNLDEWNDKLGGFRGSELTFLGGRPGTGKTRQAIRLLLDLAEQKTPVLFVSIEMPERSIWLECISIMTGIDKYKMMRGELSTEEVTQCTEEAKRLALMPFYIVDFKTTTNKWSMISRVVRRYQRDFGVKVFGLDYVQICYSGIDKIDNSKILDRLTRVSNSLSMFLKATGLDCIACAQLGRQVEGKPGKRPNSMSDLKEAGAFEQDADKVVLLYRPSAVGVTHDEEGVEYRKQATEWIIVKNRRYDIIGSFWTDKYKIEKPEQPKAEPTTQPKYDTAVPAQAGRENLEAGELPF